MATVAQAFEVFKGAIEDAGFKLVEQKTLNKDHLRVLLNGTEVTNAEDAEAVSGTFAETLLSIAVQSPLVANDANRVTDNIEVMSRLHAIRGHITKTVGTGENAVAVSVYITNERVYVDPEAVDKIIAEFSVEFE